MPDNILSSINGIDISSSEDQNTIDYPSTGSQALTPYCTTSLPPNSVSQSLIPVASSSSELPSFAPIPFLGFPDEISNRDTSGFADPQVYAPPYELDTMVEMPQFDPDEIYDSFSWSQAIFRFDEAFRWLRDEPWSDYNMRVSATVCCS